MALLLNPMTVLASCNWSTDVVKVDANTYQYSKECHGEVGVIGKALKSKTEALEARKEESEALRAEVKELKLSSAKIGESLKLKDLALNRADDIALKWRDETYNQHQRLLNQEKLAQKKGWIYFGGGVALTILSVWAAGQLKK